MCCQFSMTSCGIIILNLCLLFDRMIVLPGGTYNGNARNFNICLIFENIYSLICLTVSWRFGIRARIDVKHIALVWMVHHISTNCSNNTLHSTEHKNIFFKSAKHRMSLVDCFASLEKMTQYYDKRNGTHSNETTCCCWLQNCPPNWSVQVPKYVELLILPANPFRSQANALHVLGDVLATPPHFGKVEKTQSPHVQNNTNYIVCQKTACVTSHTCSCYHHVFVNHFLAWPHCWNISIFRSVLVCNFFGIAKPWCKHSEG